MTRRHLRTIKEVRDLTMDTWGRTFLAEKEFKNLRQKAGCARVVGDEVRKVGGGHAVRVL